MSPNRPDWTPCMYVPQVGSKVFVRCAERHLLLRQRGVRCTRGTNQRWREGRAHLESSPGSSCGQRLALHPGSSAAGLHAVAPDPTLAVRQHPPDQQGVFNVVPQREK